MCICSRDNVPMEEKVEKALVGVGDEHGLKRMIEDSDYDSDSDSDSGDDASAFSPGGDCNRRISSKG